MSERTTTTLFPDGRVVIPEEIRKRMGLDPDTQFVVVGDRDLIILKRLNAPDLSGFMPLLRRARRVAKETGLRRADVATAVAKARRRK